MQLRIDRYKFTGKSTIGRMYVNGAFFCYTLEDRQREGQKKIYGKTAIPGGTYQVVINRNTRFDANLPLLKDVSGFTGIYIHSGNSSAHTEGCILVGRTCSEDYVAYSEKAISDLVMLVSKALKKEEVTITLRNVANPQPLLAQKGKS